ncbi:hypothetical protein D9M68_208660 [compost metagenome]
MPEAAQNTTAPISAFMGLGLNLEALSAKELVRVLQLSQGALNRIACSIVGMMGRCCESIAFGICSKFAAVSGRMYSRFKLSFIVRLKGVAHVSREFCSCLTLASLPVSM